MNPIVVIRTEILSIVIILFFILYSLYCSKFHHGKNNFIYLATACLIHSCFALITEITVNDLNCNPILNRISHLIFFACALLFCLELFRYTLALVLPKNQVKIPVLIAAVICAVCVIVCAFSEIDYLHGRGTYYSAGVGPTICFAVGILIYILILFILFINCRKIQASTIIAMLPITSMGFVGLIVQILVPEFLFTAGILTLTLIGAFFAIENPIEKFEDRANIDMDTQARNRNSYEKDFRLLKKQIKENKIEYPLMYVICDINGLKNVNDTYGHLEGDTLILNAATILMDNLKKAKNIYRIGGDEFAVIYEGVRIIEVEEEIASVAAACEKVSKTMVAPLSISIGSALYNDGTDVEDMVRLADEAMYQNKDNFYKEKGINRRKVQDYAAVLRDQSAKILKVNLDDDSFTISKVSLEEKKKAEGYSDSFEAWTKGMVKAGYVHSEDIDIYNSNTDIQEWKKAFDNGQKLWSFIFRRRFGQEFFKAYVEVVPANDYSKENRSVFFYVKNLHVK